MDKKLFISPVLMTLPGGPGDDPTPTGPGSGNDSPDAKTSKNGDGFLSAFDDNT